MTVNIYELTDTWNDGVTLFNAIRMNVTDTASDSASKLLDLQVGGVSRFSVSKSTGFFATGNLVELRNGTNAQEFQLYNTYTNASIYERAFFRWNANVLEVGTEAAGTGVGRSTRIVTGASASNFMVLDLNDVTVSSNRKHVFQYQSSDILDILTTATDVYLRCQSSKRHYLGGPTSGDGWNEIWGNEVSSDPAAPAEGAYVIWMSDGTGTGDDGDILIKITAGGVTKTATLVDFSTV